MSEETSGGVAQAIAETGAGEMSGDTSQEAQGAAESIEGAEGQERTEVSAEASTEGQEPSNKEVKAAAKKVDAKQSKSDPEKFTITVDGEKLNVTKDELVKFAQMGKAGQKRMQEAAQLKNDVIDLLRTLKSNPLAVLNDPSLGLDPVKLANEIIAKRAEEESKTPEQRERDKIQAELEQLRKEKKEAEEREAKTKEEKLLQETEAEMEAEITEAIEELGLPKKPAVLKRIADIMLTAMDAKKDISIKQAASIANKELNRDFVELMGSLSDENLEGFLGKDLLKRIRTSDLKKVRSVVGESQVSESKPTAVSQPRKKIGMKDWLKSPSKAGKTNS